MPDSVFMQNSGFFDSEEGDVREYGEVEFNRYFNNIYRSGVSIDDSGSMTLKVTGGTGAVSVAPGFAIVLGYYFYNPTARSLTVSAPASNTRIDRVVVRLDKAAKTVDLALRAGTAAASPAAPALQRSGDIYELSLAQVRVTSAGVITVTDERPVESVCGAIRPKNLTEYQDMIDTFQSQWQAWFAGQQAAGWRNIYIQSTQPTSPEVGSIWIQ